MGEGGGVITEMHRWGGPRAILDLCKLGWQALRMHESPPPALFAARRLPHLTHSSPEPQPQAPPPFHPLSLTQTSLARGPPGGTQHSGAEMN